MRIGLACALVLVFLSAGLVAAHGMLDVNRGIQATAQAEAVNYQLDEIGRALAGMDAASWNYATSGDRTYLRAYEDARSVLEPSLDRLDTLVAGNGAESLAVAELAADGRQHEAAATNRIAHPHPVASAGVTTAGVTTAGVTTPGQSGAMGSSDASSAIRLEQRRQLTLVGDGLAQARSRLLVAMWSCVGTSVLLIVLLTFRVRRSHPPLLRYEGDLQSTLSSLQGATLYTDPAGVIRLRRSKAAALQANGDGSLR